MNKVNPFVFIAFLCATLTLSSIESLAQSIQICFNYRGSWSDWREANYNSRFSSFLEETPYVNISKYSDGSGYILKTKEGNEFFSFKITNYRAPSKDEIKRHLKTNTWFEYKGTVTYYVSDDYPNAESLALSNVLVAPNPRTDNTPRVQRVAEATIKVQPYKYKEIPSTYNLYFDEIGIGFCRSGMRFKGEKRKRKHIVGKIFVTLICPVAGASWIACDR